jgi:membrane-associated phospholipid phosphatase
VTDSATRPSGIGASVALCCLTALLVPVWIYNTPLFLCLNGLHSPWTDPVWLGLTTLGDGLILVIIVGAFLVVNPRVTVFGSILLLCSSFSINLVKVVFPTLRPAALLESVHIIGPLLRSGSFPSGHTASSMVAALVVAHFSRSPTVGACAITIGTLTSLSRIFVGAHFPRDVVGGMICALVLFIVFRKFVFPVYEDRIPERPDFSDRLLLAGLAVECVLVLFSMTYYAFHHAESPPVAAGAGLVLLCFVVSGWRWRWTPSSS